uniref:Uncharacterized protein n=1 Tax=Arundo donax TaxID=35708 RepID=A0A0A9AL51_ARUDO
MLNFVPPQPELIDHQIINGKRLSSAYMYYTVFMLSDDTWNQILTEFHPVLQICRLGLKQKQIPYSFNYPENYLIMCNITMKYQDMSKGII